jgi:hypothetical protein
MQSTDKSNPAIVDAKTLAPIVSLTARQIGTLTRNHVIPSIRIGHRTVRYNVAAVLAALNKHTK